MDIPEEFEEGYKEFSAFLEAGLQTSISDRTALLLPALRKSQSLFRYIPEWIQETVSKQLKVDREEIRKVIGAYSYFSEEQPAKHRVSICGGPACYMKGSHDIADKLKSELGLSCDQSITEDKQFSVETSLCLGACGQGPAAYINSRPYYSLEADSFCQTVKNLKN